MLQFNKNSTVFGNVVPTNVEEVYRTNIHGYSDLTSLIYNMALDVAYGNSVDEAPFVAFLSRLPERSNFGKKLIWSWGDRPAGSFSPNSNVVIAGTAATFSVTSAESYLTKGDVVDIVDKTSGSEKYAQAQIVEIVGTNITAVLISGDTGTYTQANTEMNSLAPRFSYDGKAGDSVSLYNKKIENWIQKFRKTVQMGAWSQADNFYGDQGLPKKIELIMRWLMEGMNKSMLYNAVPVAPTSDLDGGYAGGLSYFYQAADQAATGVDFYGRNHVLDTAMTYRDLRNYAGKLAGRGKSPYEKMVQVSPDTLSLILDIAEDHVNITRENYTFPNTDIVYNNLVNFDIGYARLWFIPDNSMRNKTMKVQSNLATKWNCDETEYETHTRQHMFFWDPMEVELVYADIPRDGGVQKPRVQILDSKSVDGDSTEKAEIKGGFSFKVGDPASGGVLAIGEEVAAL